MTPSTVDKMNFKYKVRRFNYEDGEFTDYVNVDKMTIEKVFSNNYDVDDSLKRFRTIAISTTGNKQLLSTTSREVFVTFTTFPWTVISVISKSQQLNWQGRPWDCFLKIRCPI